MSNEQLIELLRGMRRSDRLSFIEKQALAWCIAKLMKESTNGRQG